ISQEAVDALVRHRQTYPNIFIETCTQYLTLDTSSEAGVYAKVNPPVRPREDVEYLWEAFEDGVVDTIGSDHNARHRSNKEKDIWSASAGFPGLGRSEERRVGRECGARHTRSKRDWSSDVCSSDLPRYVLRSRSVREGQPAGATP